MRRHPFPLFRPGLRPTLAALFGVLLLLLPAASAQNPVAETRPVPDWLDGASQYEVRFEHRSPLLMAILLVAADREVTVIVNDQPVGSAADPGKAASLDLTSRLRPGANTLVLRSRDGAPVRAAALLELKGDLAARHWLATGAAWKTARGEGPRRIPVAAESAAHPFDPDRSIDAYSSWKLARREEQNRATDPAGFALPPGFRAELIRSAGPEEDSWVAMAFDPQGRITLAREKRGLLRLAPDGSMEILDDSLLECRGLLYAHDALYAHANNSKVLVRLSDADGDGTFEERTELLRTEGGVGHGRNHLKLGPDGHLWIACGNNVVPPAALAPSSPLRHYADDQVLPHPGDQAMFDGDVNPPAGHILRLSPDGRHVELMAGGLRNPVDLAFNRDGDLFTFDADMEWDVRTPWYMPNRVLHLVSAADFGWRRGTGRFPAWFADTLPSVLDVGLGSPTAVFFGHGGRLPARYAEALFLCDWAYGRILAVHLRPDGASYTGSMETFLSGRPLNVTDGGIGPDGALWFITGGRGTQSGLYRVSYHGPADPIPAQAAAAPAGPTPAASPERDLRRRLEAFHRGVPEAAAGEALAFVLPHLDHRDRFVRHAARVALEALPPDRWRERVLETPGTWRAILGCLALARVGDRESAPEALSTLKAAPWEGLDTERRLATLRALGVTLARYGDPEPADREALLDWLEPLYPDAASPIDQELCRLFIRLRSPVVLAATLPRLRRAETPEALLFYSLQLSRIDAGWDLEARRVVLDALRRAAAFPDGGRNHTKVVQDLRTAYAAALSPAEARDLAGLLPAPPPPAAATAPAAPVVREWRLEDLAPRLGPAGGDRGRSFARGKAAILATGCALCHRVSPDPALPAGVIGPDLVPVAARFGRRDLLDHILNPSKVVEEKYRLVTIVRSDGTRVTGTLESEDDERVMLKPNPLAPEQVAIGRSQIARREVSGVSAMPPGLLNTLSQEQILDLLAFLEAGGDPAHRLFQP